MQSNQECSPCLSESSSCIYVYIQILICYRLWNCLTVWQLSESYSFASSWTCKHAQQTLSIQRMSILPTHVVFVVSLTEVISIHHPTDSLSGICQQNIWVSIIETIYTYMGLGQRAPKLCLKSLALKTRKNKWYFSRAVLGGSFRVGLDLDARVSSHRSDWRTKTNNNEMKHQCQRNKG